MSKIVIKKKVSLEFLGEEYKGAEIVFRAIPLSEYDTLMDDMPEASEQLEELSGKLTDKTITEAEQKVLTGLIEKNKESNKDSIQVIIKYLKKYFVSGVFPNFETDKLDVLEADDLDGLDQETAMVCFERLTGQSSDPKVENPLSTPSSTTE